MFYARKGKRRLRIDRKKAIFFFKDSLFYARVQVIVALCIFVLITTYLYMVYASKRHTVSHKKNNHNLEYILRKTAHFNENNGEQYYCTLTMCQKQIF